MITTLPADWPVDSTVKALTTTRSGGVSVAPFGQLNVATHVGDLPAAVQQNRRLLSRQLNLPSEPNWLSQTHSNGLVRIGAKGLRDVPDADASYTEHAGQVLVIMTADCLPVFLATKDGSEMALVHVGWRGMANGILERALRQFKGPVESRCAWLGPAISQAAFTVGKDVREAMLTRNPAHETAFVREGRRWRADLYALARQQLQDQVSYIGGGEHCTFQESDLFFSHRRDGVSGRMASLLWREPEKS